MLRTLFEHQLHDLQDDILALGSMTEKAITRAMDALVRRDMQLAREVCDGDQVINRRRFDVEDRAVNMIAKQQPMASDLRVSITAIHIATALGRMADHAEGIARISLSLGEASFPPPLDRL